MIFITYDIDTGQILSAGDVPEKQYKYQTYDGVKTLHSTEFYLDTTHYVDLVDSPQITLKPEMVITLDKSVIYSDDVDTAVIGGLPDDCQVTIEGDTYTVTDNTFELTVPLPGIYNITIEKFPFLLKEVQIEAIT